jgi:hypothetical protein
MFRYSLFTLLIIALTACSAAPTPMPTATATLVPQSTATSIPTAAFTPVPTITPAPPTPTLTPEPTSTLALTNTESLPVFSDRGTMISSDGKLTASIPDSVLDLAGIEKVTTNPDYLTNYGKFFKATLAGQMALNPELVKKDPTLKLFQGIQFDTSLENTYKVFDANAQL